MVMILVFWKLCPARVPSGQQLMDRQDHADKQNHLKIDDSKFAG